MVFLFGPLAFPPAVWRGGGFNICRPPSVWCGSAVSPPPGGGGVEKGRVVLWPGTPTVSPPPGVGGGGLNPSCAVFVSLFFFFLSRRVGGGGLKQKLLFICSKDRFFPPAVWGAD